MLAGLLTGSKIPVGPLGAMRPRGSLATVAGRHRIVARPVGRDIPS